MKAELIADAKASLGEGPCWDGEKRLLYWVDIHGRTIHAYDAQTSSDRSFDVGVKVGAAVLKRSGGLLLATDRGFADWDPATGAMTEPLRPAGMPGHVRFNDGKCDASGRFWAGTMEPDGDKPDGTLYCYEAGVPTAKLDGIRCSNGLAWTEDRRTMYYIDSPTKRVVAFDYDPDTAAIANPRTVVEIAADGGLPDGMSIDAEGMLWVAQWGGWQVARYDPRTGRKLQSIELPAMYVTSCAFGGDRLDELYITTARTGLTEAQLAEQPLAGGLFIARPGVKGAPVASYAG